MRETLGVKFKYFGVEIFWLFSIFNHSKCFLKNYFLSNRRIIIKFEEVIYITLLRINWMIYLHSTILLLFYPLGVSLPFCCQQWHTFHCCEICHCQQCIYQQWHDSILAMTVWHCQKAISVATKLPNWSLLATMWQCGCISTIQLPKSC